MNCPECGSAAYDNRQENEQRRQRGEKLRPQFKCKKCEWVQWPPKEAKTAKQDVNIGSPAIPQADAPALTHDDMKVEALNTLIGAYDIVFGACAKIAREKLSKDVVVTADAIHAMAATVFIAAKEKGLI